VSTAPGSGAAGRGAAALRSRLGHRADAPGTVPSRRQAPWDESWQQWSPRRVGPPAATATFPRRAAEVAGTGQPAGPTAAVLAPAAARPRHRRALRLLLRWPVLTLLVFAVAIGVATDQTTSQTDAGRLTDLRNFYQAAQTGISSCSGGLHDTLVAFRAILDGSSIDRRTAENIAIAGSQACEPTSNGDLYDMVTTVPPRDLSGYGVATAATALYEWAFPLAARAQLEIQVAVEHHDGPGSPMWGRIQRDLAALRVDGQRVQLAFDQAASRLGATLAPLSPSVYRQPAL
jgi:hypothetical protein